MSPDSRLLLRQPQVCLTNGFSSHVLAALGILVICVCDASIRNGVLSQSVNDPLITASDGYELRRARL